MLADGVKAVVLAQASECFACERAIPAQVRAIRLTFNITLILKKEIVKDLHIGCARELKNVFEVEIRKAEGHRV